MMNFKILFLAIFLLARPVFSQCPPHEIECGMWCCPPGVPCINYKCKKLDLTDKPLYHLHQNITLIIDNGLDPLDRFIID